MICIADNDILLKLSVCNLMEEAVIVLESTKQEVYVLNSARYKISKDQNMRSKYGTDGIASALAFIDSVLEITQAPLPKEQDILNRVEDIDPGEQILFGATAYFDSFILATGDKRSLRALHSSSACAPIYERLSGRVLCLEQIVSRLISHLGFEKVRSRIVPVRDCDITLKAAFGSGQMSERDTTLSYLYNRTVELRAETGNLLWNA